MFKKKLEGKIKKIIYGVIFLFMFIFFLNKMFAREGQLVYWLSNIDMKRLGNTSYKYVIIDYSADGSLQKAFKPEEIKKLKNSKNKNRLVLAYISVGEAEDYRYYWKKSWKPDLNPPKWEGNPSFVGPENKNWKGNYIVKYRDPQWKKIVFNYLDKIISQGFDGVYLDTIDTYWTLSQKPYKYLWARKEMEKFIREISKYAKDKKKGFKIFVQNAEELVLDKNGKINKPYLNAIDGIGKESAFYYKSRRRSPRNIYRTIKYLKIFKDNNKTVFTIDYPDMKNKEEVKWVYSKSKKYGFIPFCGDNSLDGREEK